MQPAVPLAFLLRCTAVIAGLAAGLCAQATHVLLRDVIPSYTGSSPRNFVELQGQLYFWAAQSLYQSAIFRTDGTPQGTLLAVDPTAVGTTDIQGEDMIVCNQRLWFVSNDAANGAEAWISDGTNAGTRIVADLRPGGASSSPRFFTPLGDRCAFLADTDLFAGPSLVISDGTAGGTVAVAAAGNPSPANHRFAVLDGRLFFTGRDAASGNELWVYDPAAGTARMVMDLWPGATSSNPWIAGAAHGRVFLHAQGPSGFQIWTTDGSTVNTQAIATALRFDLANPFGAPPFAATATKAFLRSHLPQSGYTLQVWDAATATTSQILGVFPSMLCALDSVCIVAGQATTSSPAVLWRSDGTQAGTVQLGTETSTLGMQRVGSRHVFFVGNAPGVLDRELWRTDGTAAGTRMHVEVNPTRYGITGDLHLGVVAGGVCWSGNHDLYGPEPTWSAIGTGTSQPIGTSCGRAGTRLDASDAALGQTMELLGTGAFVGAFCGVVVMPPVASPLPMTPPLGPGCFVYGNPSGGPVVTVFAVTAPTWSHDVALPGASGLIGLQAVFQALYGGGPTPGGLLTTNGVLCQVGL